MNRIWGWASRYSSAARPEALLQPAVSDRGKARAHLRLEQGIDVGHDHAGPGGPLGDDLAPGIDHHAVAVSLPAVRVLSALGRREHPGEVFDRAGAQQRLPVRAPRGRGEGRGNEDDVHRRERAIELGKAHVVAHRKRDASEGRFDCAGLGARFDRSCLVEAFRSEIQPEQVDLVVARRAPPVRVVHEAAVSHLARIVALERHRAADEPHAVPPRGPGKKLLDRPGAILFLRGQLVRVAHAENAEVLGEHDELRPFLCGASDELRRGGKILIDPGRRHHLHHGGFEFGGRGHGGDCCCAGSAARASALRRSTFGSVQVPVTWYSNARTWPNGFFKILSRMSAPRPQTGFTATRTIAEMLSPTEGSTRAYRSCVSFTRSTWPCMVTCAEGPRMRKFFVVIVPLAMSTGHSTRSKANPRPKSSRKSSVSQDCMLRIPMRRAAPGSAFRNCPLYALKSRCPARVG